MITAPGVTGSARVEVLSLAGDVDRNELLRGQSTPLRLQILGTAEALEIRLKNTTPGIISMSGGDDQVVRTSGGASNIYQGTVRGLSPGDFNITYELTTGSCPCNEQENSSTASVPTRPDGETWYDDVTRSFRRGRELANDARDLWLNRDPLADDEADEVRRALERARQQLRRGVQSGDIGGETAKLLEQYVEGYETW